MDWGLYASFTAAVTLLMLIPGPTVAFIIGNSVQHKTRAGLLAVAGTGAAILVQLISAAFGMRMFLYLLAGAFEWLRWGAVLYLLWLAYYAWSAPMDESCRIRMAPSAQKIVGRAFLISLTNPKYLLFYSAFFPQFVSNEHPLEPQLVALSTTFLLIAMLVGSCWAVAARALTLSPLARNRLTAGLFASAAAGLATVPKG